MNDDLHLLVDTDIGTDDAVALAMALRLPGVRVELITTVAGNTSLENATRNALYVVELCGSEVGVYPGAAHPLVKERQPQRLLHGRDGLGDLGLPPPRRPPGSAHAVEALARAIDNAPGALTLVELGPLTNIALALQARPGLADRVSCCVVMGGTLDPEALPDFNLRADPEAARVVLRSGMRITLVPLDLSRGPTRVLPATYHAWLRSADQVCRFVGLMCRFLGGRDRTRYGWDGEAAVPDAVAMAVALEPNLVDAYVTGDVDVFPVGKDAGGLCIEPDNGTSPVRVVTRLNVEGFQALLKRAFASSVSLP